MKWKWEARHLVHLTMLAFAGASLGNVREFFGTAGHPDEVAWPLAIALGSALVILSIMLTHVDRDADSGAFGWLLVTALLLGAISGSLQMHVYEQHLERHWAVLLGFGIPLGGEVCLAFATSAYIKARGRERYRNVSRTIETAVADRLESAIDAIDAETIQRHVERTINSLARQAVDSVAAQALSYYRLAAVPSMDAETVDGEFGPQNLPKAQAARAERLAAQAEERKAMIMAYLGEQGPQGVSAIATHLSMHRDTARKFCQELAESGRLEPFERKWRLTLPVERQITGQNS